MLEDVRLLSLFSRKKHHIFLPFFASVQAEAKVEKDIL